MRHELAILRDELSEAKVCHNDLFAYLLLNGADLDHLLLPMSQQEDQAKVKRQRDQLAELQDEVDEAKRRCREAEKLLSKEKLQVEDGKFQNRQLESEVTSYRQKLETLADKNSELREQVGQ